MQRIKVIAWSIVALTVSLSGVYATRHMKTVRAAAAAQASTDQVIYINQGWSKADRGTFYWIPQGTAMMSYDIYQNLELADEVLVPRNLGGVQNQASPRREVVQPEPDVCLADVRIVGHEDRP